MKYDVEQIKRIVSCRDLLAINGIDTNSKGKARCCFHNDAHASMHVYDDGIHCFSCGAHTDVIGLASRLYDVDFNGACEILSNQYGIQPMQNDEYRRKLAEQRRKQQERASRIEKLRSEYFRLVAEYRRLDNNRARYAPRSPTEPLNKLFVKAITRIDAVEHDMQQAEWAWHDAEQENY